MNLTPLEYFGELLKEEPISLLPADMAEEVTFVLEAVSPFFGYYNDAPMAGKEPYVYIVLEHCPSFTEVARAGNRIKARVNHSLKVDPGRISVFNQQWPVLRIRDIGSYCRIKHLQSLLREEGLPLKKGTKKLEKEMALIRLQKMFYLKQIDEGLFMDADDPSKAYFSLPAPIQWEDFKKLTTEAKYETSILFFDAARVTMHLNRQLIDLVRVYREDISPDKLRAIRDRYIKVLNV